MKPAGNARAARRGRLAVKGPTGCRYLADDRQRDYVRDGAGTSPAIPSSRPRTAISTLAARNDDMIVSSGYNIAGPEVEAALLAHDDVLECAVIGVPDPGRGQIVEAHVVLMEGIAPDVTTVERLQEYVKQTIAPYKYPRRIVFTGALPKTQTGKIQRFRLRQAH